MLLPVEKPQENNVEHICDLARSGKEEELAEFLETHCVGEYVAGENAVYILAREENKKAVNLLINKFRANRNDAVIGYAEAGNLKLMNQQLAKGAMYVYALCGAVLGQHDELIDDLLRKGPFKINLAMMYAARKPEYSEIYDKLADDETNYQSYSQYDTARSAAMFGNVDFVHNLLARVARNPFVNTKETLMNAIKGAAQGNQQKLLDELLQNPLSNTAETFNRKEHYILEGIAYRGESNLFPQLLADGGNITDVMVGAAEAGKLEILLKLIKESPEENKHILLTTAAEAAGKMGHQDLVSILFEMAGKVGSFSFVLIRAIDGEQIHILNMKKLWNGLTKGHIDLLIHYLRETFVSDLRPDQILRIASFFNVKSFRDRYIETVINKNMTLKGKDEHISKLITKADVLNYLMNKYNLNYDQALAWNTPELHAWISQTSGPINTLTRDLLLYIGRFVTSLSEEDAQDLMHKMRGDYEKKLAVKGQGFFSQEEGGSSVEKKTDDTFPAPSKKIHNLIRGVIYYAAICRRTYRKQCATYMPVGTCW